MSDIAKVGDPVSCPVCGITSIANGSHDTFVENLPVALVGLSRTACPCASIVVSGLSWLYINNCHAAVHGSMTANGGTVLASSSVRTGLLSVASAQAALLNPRPKVIDGMRYSYQSDPTQPHLQGGMTFIAEPKNTCVFAKSCHAPRGTTHVGNSVEPVSNFGEIAVYGSVGHQGPLVDQTSPIAADSLLRPLRGTGLATLSTWSWSVRMGGVGVGATLSTTAALGIPALAILVGVMIPTSVGDGSLYQDQETDLSKLSEAATRVRFQFRRDSKGRVELRGIHTPPLGGADRVPTTEAIWDPRRESMIAQVNGLTITWTPDRGPQVTAPTTYPGASEILSNLLVHPIPQDQDSQITHYPGRDGEDITWSDVIVSFPRDSGLQPIYLVFASPVFHRPPKILPAFPDAEPAPMKTYVQGGGQKRRRWKDRAGSIYEWDYQHGTVEMYSKQGKHLGEFDPVTGEQTKPAKPGRKVEK